jgi:hypothetical protein
VDAAELKLNLRRFVTKISKTNNKTQKTKYMNNMDPYQTTMYDLMCSLNTIHFNFTNVTYNDNKPRHFRFQKENM